MSQQFLPKNLRRIRNSRLISKKIFLAHFAENPECNLYRKAMAVVILSLRPFFHQKLHSIGKIGKNLDSVQPFLQLMLEKLISKFPSSLAKNTKSNSN